MVLLVTLKSLASNFFVNPSDRSEACRTTIARQMDRAYAWQPALLPRPPSAQAVAPGLLSRFAVLH